MFNSRRLFLLCSRGFSSLKTPTKIEIIHSSIQNIHFNLATEEYLFDHCQLDHPILFLWRNDKTVVIGFSMNFLNENNEFFSKVDIKTLLRNVIFRIWKMIRWHFREEEVAEGPFIIIWEIHAFPF